MSTPDGESSEIPGSPDLSEDAILVILLRLPVKVLLKCKCVCKQWYTIIETQSFVEQHFHQSQERLLVRHYKPDEDNHAYALFVDDTCSGFEEPALLQMPNVIAEVLGPVNGVFCLVGPLGVLALLNPATRQLKPLPELSLQPRYGHICQNVVGFGLDPLSGDYKVVSLWYFLEKTEDYLDCQPTVLVYNLGSDSWDVKGSFNSRYRANRSVCKTYVNGVYYWTMEGTDTEVAAILAFDMTTEMCHEMHVPDCLKSKLWNLTIHGDSIALLSYQLELAGSCEVWVMEKESWNKVAVVGPFDAMHMPLCLWKNDELLIETDTLFLMLCNIFTEKRQLTQAREKENSSFMSQVFSYKESLVSVKGKSDNCLLWDASRDLLAIAWPILLILPRRDGIN